MNTTTKSFFRKYRASLVLFFALVSVLAAFRSTVFDIYKVRSFSMAPELIDGDYLVVSQFAYGLRFPFSDFLNRPFFLTAQETPKRGDVIVFRYPLKPQVNLVKRVIGLPGDTIEIREKDVIINRVVVSTADLSSDKAEKLADGLEQFSPKNFEFLTEALGSVVHPILIDKNNVVAEAYGPVVVPPFHVFVLGDNRDLSSDSRYWGFVPLELIKGRVLGIAGHLRIKLDNSIEFRRHRLARRLD